jgi:hypothetical protein
MLEPVGGADRRRRAHGWSTRVCSALAFAALLVGLGLLATERAPGIAWALVVLGAGFVSILLSQPDPRRRRE